MSASEHFRKYDELAHELGWDEVKALVPFPLDRVRDALDAGDEYLNTLPLRVWDRAAQGTMPRPHPCPTCGQQVVPKPPRHGCGGELAELFRKIKRGHSLSDGVSLLKHVARVEATR